MKHDITWRINDLISYRDTEAMGLGVFALAEIPESSVIVRDPVRTFVGKDAELLKQTDAFRMMFVDREAYDDGAPDAPVHLVLGSIGMLNHGKKSNCEVVWNIASSDDTNRFAQLVAKRKIVAGEQLLMTYHNAEEYDF